MRKRQIRNAHWLVAARFATVAAFGARRASIATFGAVVAMGCGPARDPAYAAVMAAAARDEGAGRFGDAAQHYDEADAHARRARDRDEARWDSAVTKARSGDATGAASRFEAIAADATSEHQAEAAYRLAALHVDSGDPERGWREMEQIPRRFSTHGVAHVAVRRLVERADERGPRAGLEELRALDGDLDSTELVELVAYLTAEHLEALGEERAARDAYIRIADRWPYPFGAFFDHALWRASLLDEDLTAYRTAIEDLERMLRQRETTSLVGSYERLKYVPAILRIGELYRDRLNDRASARAAFHRLYADFAHSTLRDRALWLEAALWRDDGNVDEACSRLAILVREFPDSRYVPCAVGQCPMVMRPRVSAAPAECHEYITRTNGVEREPGRPREGR